MTESETAAPEYLDEVECPVDTSRFKSGTIDVTLVYKGRDKPMPADDPTEHKEIL